MKIAPRLSRSGPRRSGRLRVAFLVFNLDGMGGTSRSAITQANALARRGNVDVRMLSVTRSADAPHYAIDPAVTVEHLVDVRGDDPRHRAPSRLVPKRWDAQFSALTDVGLEAALPDLDVDVAGHRHAGPDGRRDHARRPRRWPSSTRSTARPPTGSAGWSRCSPSRPGPPPSRC